jgi:hypothetical protein
LPIPGFGFGKANIKSTLFGSFDLLLLLESHQKLKQRPYDSSALLKCGTMRPSILSCRTTPFPSIRPFLCNFCMYVSEYVNKQPRKQRPFSCSRRARSQSRIGQQIEQHKLCHPTKKN